MFYTATTTLLNTVFQHHIAFLAIQRTSWIKFERFVAAVSAT
jgi:hypothetical protein